MKFEILKQSHIKRNIVIGVIAVLIISVMVLTFTRAKYRVTESIPLVNGTINYSLGDLNIIAMYLYGEKIDSLPSGNYALSTDSYCEINGKKTEVKLKYNSEEHSLSLSPFTTKGTKCYLYFEDKLDPIAFTIESLYSDNQDELVYDGTSDNNLRYMGADPHNYVYFNCKDYTNPNSSTCELWRIIGVFNESSHGISNTKLVKLIRDESLGKLEWNEKNINQWNDIYGVSHILNTDYLNQIGDYTSLGINLETREMIENATWEVGGKTTDENTTSEEFYIAERNTVSWNGKVAFIYPSDYGFATSGGNTKSRNSCLKEPLYQWNSNDLNECRDNNWLYDENSSYWTLTSYEDSLSTVYYINKDGNVRTIAAFNTEDVKPSIYLRSQVSISGGNGTINDPYTLIMQ